MFRIDLPLLAHRAVRVRTAHVLVRRMAAAHGRDAMLARFSAGDAPVAVGVVQLERVPLRLAFVLKAASIAVGSKTAAGLVIGVGVGGETVAIGGRVGGGVGVGGSATRLGRTSICRLSAWKV